MLTVSHLFDAVGVDCGLWLQYADWLRFLGALRHLADLFCDEVVDAIECFDCTLYQTHTFCCSCNERGAQTRVISSCNVLWVGTWRADLRDLLGAGLKSTFILRCLGNGKRSLTSYKETQLLSYSSLPPFTQSTEKQLKERNRAQLASHMGREGFLFNDVTLSLLKRWARQLL